MGAETIIAIVTAVIALITSAATFVYNLVERRKDRIQKVVLDNRVKYLDELREGFSGFIGLANAEAVKAAQDPEVKKAYFEKLFKGYGKIKTYIKPFYEIDGELLKSMDSLYEALLKALNGDGKAEELDALRKDFETRYLKYDWAYWKYIQRQKDGVYMNSDDAFDKVYYEFEKLIDGGNGRNGNQL